MRRKLVGLARTVVYNRIFGDFLAKNAVYTPYFYGSGQPYKFAPSILSMLHYCPADI